MLTIIHSGYGQEFTGNPTTSIWSHKGSLAATVTKNGVKMYNYSTEPALRGWITDTPPAIVRIGSICHETGHVFGLPDLYDYSDQTYGLGCYCIMSNGGSNGASAKPAHMCAWAKCFLGFVNPEQIHSQTAVSMPQVETSPVIKLLRDGMSNGEYFLIENRERSGFDNDPNIIPGIIIYHVDTNSSNNGLGAWPHPVVKIEEADGDNSLGAKTAFSESGDAWTSTNGLTGGFRDQTGKPNTNAMRYQTGPYSRTDSAAYYSYNTLSGFSAAGSTMTFNATTLNTTIANQTSTTGNYTVSWPACANATQYELQESVRSNLTSFTDGAEDEDAMYENWNLAGTVKRDSTGKRSGTYCYAMNLAFNSIWGSDMQALTQRKPFTATSSTVVSFYFMSHLTTGDGALSCQISNDNGSTWKVLGSYSGTASEAWQPQSYNFAAMSAAGITSGDQCLLRFIANFEFTFGTATFPGYGFALDDISITGTSIAGYSSWTSLAGNLTTTSYSRTGKPSGTYGYRVRAYSNAVWQSFGATGETTVAIPLTVTINQAAAQADPTNGATVNFTVVFNQPITVFDSGKIIISGTTPGTKAITVTGSGTVYNVAVSGMTGPGTVIATVAARAAAGLDGLASPASTSTDNTVTFDATPPQVTISQAAGQTDPTATSTIDFTAVFSEQVVDFTAGDVTISGTAPGTKTVTVTGTGSVYNVEVSGMTGVGTVTATIAAGVVHDRAGNPNTAATSVDNTVTLVLTQHQTGLQLWFGTTTGTGQAADTEDPNHNGISNLMEYALGGDPVGRTTGTAILPKATRDTHGSLQSSFTRYTDRSGLTLTVQGADSAAGPWADLASSTNGTAFVAILPYVTVAETGTGGSRAVTITDIFQVGTPIPTNRFMRLRVSAP